MTGATESMSVRKGKWVKAAEKEQGEREVTKQNSAGVKLGGRLPAHARGCLNPTMSGFVNSICVCLSH